MSRSSRQPTIERRSHRRSDGTTTASWSLRYNDVRGVRRRRSFASAEEAEFERARLALEAIAPITRAAVVDVNVSRVKKAVDDWINQTARRSRSTFPRFRSSAMRLRTPEVGRWPSASGDSERCLVDVSEAGLQLARR